MRHQKTRNKLSRDSAHRKALLMNLTKEVLEHERIKTTEAKAKAVKPEIEKLITLAKTDTLHARAASARRACAGQVRGALPAPAHLPPRGAALRLQLDFLKRSSRPCSDATEMVFLELV